MQQRAIGLEKALAAAVTAIGLGLASGHALAEDIVLASAQTQSAVQSVTPRPIIIKAMTVGGLKPGEVMRITEGQSEVLTPAQLAQRVSLLPKSRTGLDSCVTF
jgi:hypothetical protein